MTPSLKFKLTISFDGKAWQGWQSQKSGLAIQDQVETALAILFPSHPKLTSSSRTDAGVHAYGLVAHFEIPEHELRMHERHLLLAINALLPEDIRIRSARRAPKTFHARFDAIGKEYRYEIWNHPSMNPLLRHTVWHVPQGLNIDAMREAAQHLIGRHDFRSFTTNRGVPLEDAIRTLTRCDIKTPGNKITVIIEGSGFLYKMCRCIVGTLIQIGQGKFPSDATRQMLEQRDRKSSGMNAPAHGLTLWKVFYPKRK